METNVTITMTLDEYAMYTGHYAALKKVEAENEALQQDIRALAEIVCRELKPLLDGKKPKLGAYAANLLYDKAEAILRSLKQ